MNTRMTSDNMKSAQENPAPFRSILFLNPPDANLDELNEPEIFSDLNLDQVVEAITAGRVEYNLKPFFYLPLANVESISYRHGAFRDLEDRKLIEHLRSFSYKMQRMRHVCAQEQKLYYPRQKQSLFRDAVEIYCDAIKNLYRELDRLDLHSEGFSGFCDYLSAYVESSQFTELVADTERLKGDLGGITYSLHVTDKRIAVSRHGSEPDYGANVLQTFEKFSQGAVKEHRFRIFSSPDMNHVEAAILDMVAKLYPEIFSFLEQYSDRHRDYLDPTIARFDREVQFYLAWLEYMERFSHSGLSFCHPTVSSQSKEVYGRQVFDLALANKLINQGASIITNDFSLQNPEHIFVVSGPNQGGKTTFARMFGQLHYLASIGCPVPGEEARLFLCDRIFSHFEREEDIRNLSGKLEDDLLRIHQILDQATPNSIVIMNESFLSTTLSDALYLSRQIMQRLIMLDVLCVTVTFVDELASMSETTVSMVSTVDPKDPALRTFKIIRKRADGRAYAAAIAEKYWLTSDLVKRRINKNRKGHLTP